MSPGDPITVRYWFRPAVQATLIELGDPWSCVEEDVDDIGTVRYIALTSMIEPRR